MLGTIIGDIVGSRFEFDNVRSVEFELFTDECSFTDDTICTVSVADAILNGRSYADSLHGWCREYPHPMGGYGVSFAQWVHSDAPRPYYSFGNGAAMRVGPVGWLLNDELSVACVAGLTAEITHNHPEGVKGAQVIALCVFMLRKGSTKEWIREFVESKYGALPKYRPFSNPFNETCMNAVPVAVSCFLASADFEDAIRKAILVGGDSDTIGAITGSLAEAYYEVPDALRARALAYLPDEMKTIVDQFYKRAYAA
jgi:ADP-ribosylglycohydrolase